ncbi:MAG: hypothetical protein H7Z42_04945, partial [Roseiflexaceae bacterium]|nr:hypothetical protein [Roseiflexaceae bacterium]
MSSTASASAQRPSTGGIFRATLLGALVAVVVNVILWALMQFVFNLNLHIQAGGPGTPMVPLPVVPVIVLTVVPALVAGGLFWLLARFTARAPLIFLIIALLVLVLSFAPGFLAFPGETVNALGLNVLHIGAAVPIVWALIGRGRA